MYVCMCIGYNVINRKILRSLEGGKKDTCCTQYELKKNVPVACFLAVVREDPLVENSQKIKQ